MSNNNSRDAETRRRHEIAESKIKEEKSNDIELKNGRQGWPKWKTGKRLSTDPKWVQHVNDSLVRVESDWLRVGKFDAPTMGEWMHKQSARIRNKSVRYLPNMDI